ncbi:MAG: site-specific integrase [Deltaproteobacteria bacterium]|nr:site-specific integrase [Deltaproteobacteria bacterium]
MAIYRLAAARCPDCGRWARRQLGEEHARRKKIRLTCPCGASWSADVPADEWHASWREPSGKYHRERFEGADGRAKAVAAEAEARKLIRSGCYQGAPTDAPGTLGALLALHLEHVRPGRRPRNVANLGSMHKVLIGSLSPDLPLAKLGTAALEAYRQGRADAGRATATINRELAALSAALRWALSKGWIQRMPRFEMPPPRNEQTEFLSRDEVARVLLVANEPMRSLFRFAAATGCRQGEILALRWSWISERTRMLNLPADATKNGRSRHVPLNTDALEALAVRRREACGELVFHRGDGEALNSAVAWRAWANALKAAGVRHVRFHALRHTYASWLAEAGVDLNRIRELLGHRSLGQVMRYSHLRPEHLAAAAELACLGAGPKATPKVGSIASLADARDSRDLH